MSPPQKKVAFVTGTRAEFGLLTPVLKALRAREGIATLIYATGTHPIAAYGYTLDEMTATGFPPDRIIDMLVGGDSCAAMYCGTRRPVRAAGSGDRRLVA
jgi:UDP-N-acetylglucosamine 2-epimerase (non-hydrolysing)/GDP/UDP-N,N'-diacetylbacillosamine 2-epimerase (hydrolysing)